MLFIIYSNIYIKYILFYYFLVFVIYINLKLYSIFIKDMVYSGRRQSAISAMHTF